LLAERPLEDLGQAIVTAVKQTFALSAVALLASIGDRLEVVAAEGTALSDSELTGLKSGTSEPVRLSTGAPNEKAHILALSTSGRPVGLLVMRGLLGDRELREMLPTLANHLALAVERAQLHERALRTEVLEEVDRLRGALVGGVSHDLRTPLSTIKIAATTLSDPAHDLSEEDARELYELIDVQADRLTRVVTSLLDMTRLEAGVLKLDRSACSVLDLVGEAVAALRPALSGMEVRLEIPPDLPEVDVDHMLIGQVLTNLLENAHRHAPPGTVITVRGSNHGSELVALTVSDRGPGVRPSERQSVFESFVKFDTGGRAGLGLALAKTFVEAHGGRIWVEDTPGGGASFVFTVSAANATAAHALP
jgi:two-component system sensor histidine kinase KdpD